MKVARTISHDENNKASDSAMGQYRVPLLALVFLGALSRVPWVSCIAGTRTNLENRQTIDHAPPSILNRNPRNRLFCAVRSAFLRRKASGFLRVALTQWSDTIIQPTLPVILHQMRRGLFDPDATVRREGRYTFAEFIRSWRVDDSNVSQFCFL